MEAAVMEPEQMQELRQKELLDRLYQLAEIYGRQVLREHTLGYAGRLNTLAELNKDLARLDPENQEADYDETVRGIIEATQDYYAYIGQLPEDLRKFFLSIADTVNVNDGTIEEINSLMDADIPLDSSPLLSVQSIRPRSYIMQIDAITSHLASLGDETQLRVGSRGSQPIKTTVTLDMPDHMKIEGGAVLGPYDKSIINGVTSLMESGNTVFSIPMLYHAMTGKQNPTVDEGLYEEISMKLEQMRRMMLAIDMTQEIQARYITDECGEPVRVDHMTLEGYLLPLNRVTGMVNGRHTQLYQLIQHPPLYTYSKMRRQLASVPISLLGAPINNNSTTIPLKTYLLQRIEMMKNRRNSIVSTHILYESVYAELGAQEANKTKKMRIRNYTTTILQYFVQQRYIKNYVEYKKGRIITGVDILL